MSIIFLMIVELKQASAQQPKMEVKKNKQKEEDGKKKVNSEGRTTQHKPSQSNNTCKKHLIVYNNYMLTPNT